MRDYIAKGMSGENVGIPFENPRLTNCFQIRKASLYLLGGFAGCLSGDTHIQIARRKDYPGTRTYSLRELYHKFNRIPIGTRRNGHFWNRNIPTRTLSFKGDYIISNEIISVIQSGIKETFTIITETGKQLRATKDHRFLILENNIEDGTIYRRLEELNVGDYISCRSNTKAEGRKKRPYRPEIMAKMPYYPTARIKLVKENGSIYEYHRIKRTRAVYDAYINGVSLEIFLEQVKTNPNHNYTFSSTTNDIHHIDENPLNDTPNNLVQLEKTEHSRIHGIDKSIMHFGDRMVWKEKIVSIELYGKEMTYDIEMKAPYNNFLANDIVVHNSGKTSFVDELFVLQPFDYLKNNGLLGLYKVIYWSMERPKEQKMAKWLSRRIFLEHGILIDPRRIQGWYNKTNPLTDDEIDLCLKETDYLDELFETTIRFHSGRVNPTGIRKYNTGYAENHGKIEDLDKYNKIYIPNDSKKIVMNIFDHIGKIKTESGKEKKKNLDDFSDDCSNTYRDLYGHSSLLISQFNRGIANPLRIKNGDVEPAAEDFKETGDTYEDCDICMSLFDPWKYKVPDPSGYELEKLKREDGAKMYRNIRLLKNNHGVEDMRFGFGYQVETGIFKLLPKLRDVTEENYRAILDSSYFIQ